MKKYLTIQERTIIEWELKQGSSLRQVAKLLNRHHSTIIYEVGKNSYRGKYMASQAEAFSKEKLKKRGAKLQMALHWHLLIYIEQAFDKNFRSLNLVLQDWKKMNKHAPSLATLYNWVPKGMLPSGYSDLLRPQKRAQIQVKKWKRMIGRPISLREKEQDMSEFGHWEGDFVVGGQTKAKGYVLTLLEKKTRFAITQKFKTKDPRKVLELMTELLKELDERIFKSITWDNGVEFSHLNHLEDIFKTKIYFAFPYSSWQRGQNENWNGLLRRLFPKGTNFNKVSAQELTYVTNRFNQMPRKILNYKTPQELFEKYAHCTVNQ